MIQTMLKALAIVLIALAAASGFGLTATGQVRVYVDTSLDDWEEITWKSALQDAFEPAPVEIEPELETTRFTFRTRNRETQPVELKVYNARGIEIQRRRVNIRNGTNYIDVDLSTMNPGFYIVIAWSVDDYPLTHFILRRQ